MLPALLVVGISITVSYLLLFFMKRGALAALDMSRATLEVLSDFSKVSETLFIAYWLGMFFFTLIALLWYWRVSLWIFGPFVRLNTDLDKVLAGEKSASELYVRHKDAICPLVEKFKKIIELHKIPEKT